MKTAVNVTWTGGMAFEAEVNGHTLIMDADEAVGGQDQGPRPKALVLSALAGCTGMDVVSILKKMRVDVEKFEMKLEGELAEEHPKIYHTIYMTYIFHGKNLPMEKLENAVNLSKDKYCSVSAMIKGKVNIVTKIEVVETA